MKHAQNVNETFFNPTLSSQTLEWKTRFTYSLTRSVPRAPDQMAHHQPRAKRGGEGVARIKNTMCLLALLYFSLQIIPSCRKELELLLLQLVDICSVKKKRQNRINTQSASQSGSPQVATEISTRWVIFHDFCCCDESDELHHPTRRPIE